MLSATRSTAPSAGLRWSRPIARSCWSSVAVPQRAETPGSALAPALTGLLRLREQRADIRRTERARRQVPGAARADALRLVVDVRGLGGHALRARAVGIALGINVLRRDALLARSLQLASSLRRRAWETVSTGSVTTSLETRPTRTGATRHRRDN